MAETVPRKEQKEVGLICVSHKQCFCRSVLGCKAYGWLAQFKAVNGQIKRMFFLFAACQSCRTFGPEIKMKTIIFILHFF